MKIITKKSINQELLGEREINTYSYNDETGESNDGMRSSLAYTVHCKVYGILENEQKNSDGTYSYDYNSRITTSENQTRMKEPQKSEDEFNQMIEELIFKYNIHDFSIEGQEKDISISNYNITINANCSYNKIDSNPYLKYNYYIGDKKNKRDNIILWSGYEKIETESIEDLNNQIKEKFSKDNYISYLLDFNVSKTYQIKLKLNEIGEDETVEEFLKKIKVQSPQSKTLEDALKKEEININDIENFISNNKNIDGSNFPSSILEEIFKKDTELATHFLENTMDTELLRKYNPNFDITKIDPSKLTPEDLKAVLEGADKINFYSANGKEYIKYLEQFYNNADTLKEILPVINTLKTPYIGITKFTKGIPNETLTKEEIRDIILNTENIKIYKILEYEFDYDEKTAKKLLGFIENVTERISLSELNSIIEISKKNNIDNDTILEKLRKNKFNIHFDNEQLEGFKQLGIKGIEMSDIHDTMLRKKDFGLLSIVDSVDENQISKEFYNILNMLAEKNGKSNNEDKKRYEEMFELIENYSNTQELFSKLNPEIKDLTKRIIIENLDIDQQMEKYSIGYYGSFNKIMKTLTTSFDINMKDLTLIYMKCLNTGAIKEKTIDVIREFVSEEQIEELKNVITKSNIYPAPKKNWLTDNNLKRISIDEDKENRASIKSKIQEDGRCFSTRIKTDLEGISKEGKKIPVNNLSKWLFGVPGTKGYLTVTRRGDYIQLPSNTPEEVIELIESVLKERNQEGPSLDD